MRGSSENALQDRPEMEFQRGHHDRDEAHYTSNKSSKIQNTPGA